MSGAADRPGDHRPAVAARRREKMRRRLVEAAVFVIAAKGPGGAVIEDVVAEAGVARGTFYKYFETFGELLAEAKMALGGELVEMVIAAECRNEDLARTVARDLRLFLATAQRYPLVGQFATQMGLQGLGTGNLVHEVVPAYLARGAEQGRFLRMPQSLAVDFLQVCMIAVLRRDCAGEAPDHTAAVAALLRMLGLAAEEAEEIAVRPVAPLEAPPGSLIARSEVVRRSRLGAGEG
ncbi:TetR family transcriptional regulator [Aquicoccus sp. SCR17]|nr:TetR family transcriptional regulator [Carideicomes alvinocaridis]